MQVRGIETILGMRLTEQLGKNIFLTEAGREVLRTSQAITARLDDLQHNLAQLCILDSGQLSLAATSTVNAIATGLLARFRRRHSGLSIHLDVSNRAQALNRWPPTEPIWPSWDRCPRPSAWRPPASWTTRFPPRAARTHPLVRKKRISIGDLAAQSFLRAPARLPLALWDFFEDRGLAIRFRMK